MNSISGFPAPLQAPENLHGFAPRADRARFLDQRMRLRLAESLRYIVEQGGEHLLVSRDQFEKFLSQLENQPISPLAFSFYSDVVLAIEEDDMEEASRLLRESVELPPVTGEMRISELADPSEDATAARYARFIDTDEAIKFEIFPPSPGAAASCREQILGAFALMEAGDANLAAEIRALLREIILAAGTKKPQAMTFDGASAFMLWGAIIINCNRSDEELGMVQMLAHESAHNLLFGLSADDSLVENSPAELFPSPLRMDPRPMDGIYHATFVTARMHRVVARLIESGVLSATQREKAQRELADNARLFASGMETIGRHGRLTNLGAEVMAGANAYMRNAQ